MRITFSTPDGDVTDLDLPDEMSLTDIQPLLEEDLKLASNHMAFFYNGILLADKQKTLKQLGLKENEMILVRSKANAQQSVSSNGASTTAGATPTTATPFPHIDFSSVRIPTAARNAAGSSRSGSRAQRQSQSNSQAVENIPEGQIRGIIAQCKQNPSALDSIRDRNPALADAIKAENVADVRRIMKEDQDRIRRLYDNPLDPEAQRLIEDEIRRQNVQGNLETAIEHLPEVFATVTMLYIRCRVNDREVLAFVDSGAQSTIMSKACAERCGLLRLMDSRFSGIAKGVGTQRILGRIHLAQLDVGGVFVPTSFTVLEDQPMDMLIGLDMLKRHQCVIDLARNVLVFGTAGKEAAFLSESELPAYAKLHLMGEDSSTSGEATSSASSSSFTFEPSEDAISQLVQMGFDRQQAVQKLKKFFGDVNASASELLNERK